MAVLAAAYSGLDWLGRKSPVDDPALLSIFGTYEIDQVLAASPTPEAATIRLKGKRFAINDSRINSEHRLVRNPRYVLEPLSLDHHAPQEMLDLLNEDGVLQYAIFDARDRDTPLTLFIFGDTLCLATDKDTPGAGNLGDYYRLKRVDADIAGILFPEPIEADAVAVSWTYNMHLPPKEKEITGSEEVKTLVHFYNELQLRRVDGVGMRYVDVELAYVQDGKTIAILNVGFDSICTVSAKDLPNTTYIIENDSFKYSNLTDYF